MQKLHTLSAIPLLVLSTFIAPVLSQVKLDVESGGVFSGYNDVRIPGKDGTLFSLSDDLSADPAFFYRIQVSSTLGSRHHLSALFAPLSIDSEGRLNRDISFAGETFPANTPLAASYRFNSYRVSYFYDFVSKDKIHLGIGLTAKIRDARIAVEGDGRAAEKTNVGFVPLIRLRLWWSLSDEIALLVDGDGLAAPQGRAEDVLLALTLYPSDRVVFKLGYRILEGGADNDEVYTFALFHYAVLGAMFHF